MKKLVVGILAHVDAGKTTLSESLLYTSGALRKLGRVDNRDAFLDTFELERARGITIFSKQALLSYEDLEITLLDTPGHVDFSAEMERTLQVLDYAILIINGADGVQGHTRTLWKLLQRYEIPTFLFVNKMDQPGTDATKLLTELRRKLDERCVAFGPEAERDREAFCDGLAMCDEALMEAFLERGELSEGEIAAAIGARQLFPCYFGSALKVVGVEDLLAGITRYAKVPVRGSEFGAKVYKIARDDAGKRLTYLKVTGGALRVKDVLRGGAAMSVGDREGQGTHAGNRGSNANDEAWEEKVDQIRIYSGAKFEAVSEAAAGTICAVTGLTKTFAGQGLGAEPTSELPMLEPVLTYQILLPPDKDALRMLPSLRQLEEEEPQLHILWDEKLREIHAQLMGEVQIEVMKSLIRQRFGADVEFGPGNIVYRETIVGPVEGVGHFEPLRHYAEVHLLLEPGERGSGLQFSSVCSEDVLDRNWQRLILTHLEEREHVGVLTGSAITDMKITLLTGKSHLKHTEGGDFRQATYRAVRQGLMEAETVLLEPWYEFRLEVPAENIGRAMADIQKMNGSFQSPELEGETAVLMGAAPVYAMRDYPAQVIAYTHGRGQMTFTLKGYEPCHNMAEVVEAIGYDPESDLENPTGSVFCAHGAGFVVPWDQVKGYMHLGAWDEGAAEREDVAAIPAIPSTPGGVPDYFVDDEEMQAILQRTFGQNKKEKGKDHGWKRKRPEDAWGGRTSRGAGTREYAVTGPTKPITQPGRPEAREVKQFTADPGSREYLLVDGYNIIHAWEDLRDLAAVSLDGARGKLQDILCNYQGYKKCTVIVVFDAYKLEGHAVEVSKYHNIFLVFTQEAETADQYIEKVAHEIGRKYNVTVATSDGLEQVIIRGQGCRLLSARELREEIEYVQQEIRREHLAECRQAGNYLFNHLDDELAEYMEEVRLGRIRPEEEQ